MNITPDSLVADIATANPATIRVFQRHRIDFCCGGKIPLTDACAQSGVDTGALLGELEASTLSNEADADWTRAPLTELAAYIQRRFHVPLAEELPRLRAMVDKVVSRHGDRLPDLLLPLQATFRNFQHGLLAHMKKEDAVLFPAIVALEAGETPTLGADWSWIDQPIDVMESEHAAAGDALARMAALTGGYVPPDDACPTFRGLYYGLAELEREMHLHVHLENNILFPRASALSQSAVTPQRA